MLIRRLADFASDDEAMEKALQDWSAIGRPLAFSLIAGLSTSLGALMAVIKRPDQQAMAFLLGLAAGVMTCVSVVELIIKNALERRRYMMLFLNSFLVLSSYSLHYQLSSLVICCTGSVFILPTSTFHGLDGQEGSAISSIRAARDRET